MWDKHRQARKDSRKRAIRAAQARAARRSEDAPAAATAGPEPEPKGADEAAEPEDAAPYEAIAEEPQCAPEPAQHDPAGSLAWTGLVLLTLVLGGFMAAIIFMLG